MGRIFLSDCAAGDLVEEVFCVSGKQLAPASNGTHYIKLFVSDRTAQLNGRLWKATRDIFNGLPENGFVRIRGRIENYQNNLQLVIEQHWPAREGTFDIADLLPHTEKDIPTMCGKMVEILGSIQNRHLAALVQAYLDDDKLMARFSRAPAAQSFHHAFLGGLLEHTLNALEVADAMVRFYPGLNRDLVLAGIFLHDIAKTWELSYDNAFGYTDGGQLVGHIVKSAIWVEQKALEAERMLGEKVPQDLIDVMQHIIISHHGLPEFGAVKTPATPEAIAVHYIENLDAKLMIALAATRGTRPQGDGNWTEYLKAFGGRLYRPDVAPADVSSEDPQNTPGGTEGAAAEPVLAGGGLVINNPLFESSPNKRK